MLALEYTAGRFRCPKSENEFAPNSSIIVESPRGLAPLWFFCLFAISSSAALRFATFEA
jgi:hypothetical protein